MGQAKRNGIKEERIAQAIERNEKHQKRARRFFHLCRFISPNATRESIIACGYNRGFTALESELPARRKRMIQADLAYASIFAMAGLFNDGYSLPKKGFR